MQRGNAEVAQGSSFAENHSLQHSVSHSLECYRDLPEPRRGIPDDLPCLTSESKIGAMLVRFPIILEQGEHSAEMANMYYAHIPALGLTTHGDGVEAARSAALDLLTLWIAEKQAAGEPVAPVGEFLFSSVELEVDALQSA